MGYSRVRVDGASGQEFQNLEDTEVNYREMGFEDVRGFRQMSPRERGMLKHLFHLRNEMAQKVDRPVHFVMNTKRMIELVKNPPRTEDGWKNLKSLALF